ncbi:hypothetical protein L1987_53665 [Smallanthus sonchifolius]|uniref:Uncharacterized protein n=1 Tax=Smallanthus sonchifolius TaxID=185202 RepID=A0ACB9EXS5_9ASTR|nr:hypothetical protein L1987_53665 [Smallanthus sonchifolius]
MIKKTRTNHGCPTSILFICRSNPGLSFQYGLQHYIKRKRNRRAETRFRRRRSSNHTLHPHRSESKSTNNKTLNPQIISTLRGSDW